MQLLEYLKLKEQTVSDFADEVGMRVDTVWRHAHGKRRPGPEDIDRYDEATQGAVRLQDWHELAKRAEQKDDDPPVAATG